MISGSGSQHWPQTRDFHDLLVNDYAADPADLHVLIADGKEPDTSAEIVDGMATRETLGAAFAKIAAEIDEDDLFLFYVEWHGKGYVGRIPEIKRNAAYHGFFGSPPLIAGEGDEKDFKESELNLSLFCAAGGLLTGRDFHYGMGEWGVAYYPRSKMVRYRVMSHFGDVQVAGMGKLSDSDVLLERFTDYTLGDHNKNGRIEKDLGEVWDPDGDGKPPWDPETGEFDEDDWGEIDKFEDDCSSGAWHSKLGGVKFTVWDAGLDNRADIDINPGEQLEVDGTDTDNDGCIDGFDLNDDGDMDDWVSVHETIQIHRDELIDDEVRDYADTITKGTKVFLINSCFGGGFVNDLSSDNTIILCGSPEECSASAQVMPKKLIEAFGEKFDQADADGDGMVSFLEAFNYVCVRRQSGSGGGFYRFQYDDNGDGISQEGLLPKGGDGTLGSRVGLRKTAKAGTDPDTERDGQGGSPTEPNVQN
ncbi:hypothetical protein [Haloferula sp. A504]|uniref:hypothetical protein n=1 Tax=Haloferula sp. A504 TaxID=3373601 RepID=UPI0031C207AB|nr:hypothetical protein [Verrucomicrobiaceae bacterium E54]